MPHDLQSYLQLDTAQGRHTCPLCASSDGLSVAPDEGDSGVYHCFSCLSGGTGAQLYAELEDVPIAEALQAFGVQSARVSGDVKQKEQAAPRPQLPDYTEAQWKERTRVYMAMAAEEVVLRSLYRERRTAAREGRDRDAFQRWQGKLDALFEHVLGRELRGQRRAGFVDADTEHLELDSL